MNRLPAKGIFVLSIDTEMAWGFADSPELVRKHFSNFLRAPDMMEKLLGLLNQWRISATWALVGCLMMDPGEDGVQLKAVTEIYQTNFPGSWLGRGLELLPERIWFAKNILEKVLDSPVCQEVGFHSFSHIIYDQVGPAAAALDLDLCRQLSDRLGLQAHSFIFPRNRAAHIKAVSNAGFSVYRGPERSWYHGLGYCRRSAHFLDQLLGLSPPVSEGGFDQGLIEIPASMFLMPMTGVRRLIPIRSRVNKAIKGIKKAIRERKIFHLWFHPFNLCPDLLKGLEEILAFAAEQRDRGDLEIKTLGSLGQEIRASMHKI